jgi:hypothetical protein
MTTRIELNTMLAAYETYVGGGNLKQAGRLLPKIIRSVIAFVEERTPDHVEEAAPKTPFTSDVLHAPAPCLPCDVSVANNGLLLEEFKTPIVAADGTVLGAYSIEPGAAERVLAESGIDLEAEVKAAADALVAAADAAHASEQDEEDEAEEPATETEEPPVKEAVAPAPKTPKKPKSTT